MNEAEFQKMLDAKLPLVLKTGNRNLVYFIVSTLISVVSLMVLIFEPGSAGQKLVPILFIGMCLYIAYDYLAIILYGDFGLSIDSSGFTVQDRQNQRYLWKDVSEFGVGTNPYRRRALFSQFVLFNDISQPSDSKLSGFFAIKKTTDSPGIAGKYYNRGDYNTGKILNFNNTLPDTYGMSTYQLARLMNHWREKALQQPA